VLILAADYLAGIMNNCNVSRVLLFVGDVHVFVEGSGRSCMGGGRCNDFP